MPHTLYYFAYGSNLWLNQMARRCPDSSFVGVAVLKDWKWFISTRGYANVIHSPGDAVYGMLYTLTPADEENLDGYEGTPDPYVKQMHEVEMDGQTIKSLVYVDIMRVHEGKIKEEYIIRMGNAILDALDKGIPEWYMEKYLRPFVER